MPAPKAKADEVGVFARAPKFTDDKPPTYWHKPNNKIIALHILEKETTFNTLYLIKGN